MSSDEWSVADRAAFDAAYHALMPYTQHAQVRGDIAERVVDTLRNYHRSVAVEVLLERWPAGYTRINHACLSQAVIAAANARKAAL